MASIPNGIINWTIYKITSPSNRVYVGLTSDFEKRMKSYKSSDCPHQKLINKSINKYGFNSHNVEILDTFLSTTQYAHGKEIFWIRSFMSNRRKYKDMNGLNLTDGGEGFLGGSHSEETKEKLRKFALGRKASEDTKRKMSITRTGKKINRTYTPEQIEELRERGKKLVHSQTTKEKMRQNMMGNKRGVGVVKSQEVRERTRLRMMGNKYGKGPNEKNKEAIREAIKKKRIPILQYTLSGVFIKEHLGVLEAQRELGINNISGVLTGKLKHSANFIFKYK